MKADAELDATVAAVTSLGRPTAEEVGAFLEIQKSAAHARLQAALHKGRLSRFGEGKRGSPYRFGVAEAPELGRLRVPR